MDVEDSKEFVTVKVRRSQFDQMDLEDDRLCTENTDNSICDDADKAGVPLREQDRFLPIANISKIMKRAIPETGKVTKDARECIQECVSEFISFITSEASEKCHFEKRKTINGEDILYAMKVLGFDNYIAPLKIYLMKCREAARSEKTTQFAKMLSNPTSLCGSLSLLPSTVTTTSNSEKIAVLTYKHK